MNEKLGDDDKVALSVFITPTVRLRLQQPAMTHNASSVLQNNEIECSICWDPITGSQNKDIKLGCGCLIHLDCLLHYVKTQLQDKFLLMTTFKDTGLVGVLCPFVRADKCTYSNTKVLHGLVDETRVSLVCVEDLEKLVHITNTKEVISDHTISAADISKLKTWFAECANGLYDHEAEQTDSFILATTKQCPNEKCKHRATHYHGHACHHISPYGGCPSCKTHYCYRCLSSDTQNTKLRGHAARCLCGNWSNFCGAITSPTDILRFIDNKPYPHDKRCGCVICPDCRPRRPCGSCGGHCVVCQGFVQPGPPDLTTEYVAQTTEFIKSSALNNLMAACRSRDLVKIQLLLPEIEDINGTDNIGRTAMHYACDGLNCNETVELLVLHGAQLNVTDRDGRTVFHYAVENNNISLIQHLVYSLRCDLSVLSMVERINNYTPLHLAVKKGSLEVVNMLINLLPIETIRCVDNFGRSALHLACQLCPVVMTSTGMINAYHQIAQALLPMFTDILHSSRDHSGRTVLYNACSTFMSLEFIRLLCTTGNAPPRFILQHTAANGVVTKQTMLHTLMSDVNQTKKALEYVTALADLIFNTSSGSDATADDTEEEVRMVNEVDGSGNTALHYCCGLHYVSYDLFCLLRSYGANDAVVNSSGMTPLHLVFQRSHNNNRGSTTVAKLLLKSCEDFSHQNVHGNTVLHTCCEEGYLDFAVQIVNKCKQSDLVLENTDGCTVLETVCRLNTYSPDMFDVAEMLMQRAPHSHQQLLRALFSAVKRDHKYLVKLLVGSIFTPTLPSAMKREFLLHTDAHRQTLLTAACHSGSLESVKIVLSLIDSACAEAMNATDDCGNTALHYACQHINKTNKILRMLLTDSKKRTWPLPNVNIVNAAGHSPLYYAQEQGCEDMIKLLINCGATLP